MAYYDRSSFSAFYVKVAETPEEVKELLEVGFEHVCEKDGLLFFRKREWRPKNDEERQKKMKVIADQPYSGDITR